MPDQQPGNRGPWIHRFRRDQCRLESTSVDGGAVKALFFHAACKEKEKVPMRNQFPEWVCQRFLTDLTTGSKEEKEKRGVRSGVGRKDEESQRGGNKGVCCPVCTWP